jgi:hypothetical protein
MEVTLPGANSRRIIPTAMQWVSEVQETPKSLSSPRKFGLGTSTAVVPSKWIRTPLSDDMPADMHQVEDTHDTDQRVFPEKVGLGLGMIVPVFTTASAGAAAERNPITMANARRRAVRGDRKFFIVSTYCNLVPDR